LLCSSGGCLQPILYQFGQFGRDLQAKSHNTRPEMVNQPGVQLKTTNPITQAALNTQCKDLHPLNQANTPQLNQFFKLDQNRFYFGLIWLRIQPIVQVMSPLTQTERTSKKTNQH